jgi:2-dehydro-3-deoxygluconokinase
VALLGTDDPHETVRRGLALGAGAVAVTLGPDGVLLGTGDADPIGVPAVPVAIEVDQTGAGDNFTGALAAWLSRGATLLDAVRAGTAAASVSLGGQGGTGRVAELAEITEILRRHTV